MGLLDKLFKGVKKKGSCCQFEVEEIKDEKDEKDEKGKAGEAGEEAQEQDKDDNTPGSCCS